MIKNIATVVVVVTIIAGCFIAVLHFGGMDADDVKRAAVGIYNDAVPPMLKIK